MLNGKVVLVTGSTMGIGEAIARECVKEGANVMITGIEEGLASSLCAELGSQSSYHIGDLSEASFCAELIKTTIDRFGRLNGLVNNAALISRDTIEAFEAELFLRIIKTNVLAPLLLIKEALPFLEGSFGSIVNIGSTNGFCGEGIQISYSAAKGALVNVSRTLSNHLSLENKKIRVNHLDVGWVLTESEIERKIMDGFPHGWQDNLTQTDIPFGRMILPEDIAHHVVFWLSDQSFPATGSVVTISQNPYKKKSKLPKGLE